MKQSIIYHNLCNARKTVFLWTIIGLNAYARNKKRSQINRLKLYLKNLENWIETEAHIT